MNGNDLIQWDMYEIQTESTPIHGVMLRGRIRKLGLQQGFNVLCENASDAENCVRFALIAGADAQPVMTYLAGVVPDARVVLVASTVYNPVLSKLKVNKEERYSL